MNLVKRFPGSKIQFVEYENKMGEKIQDTEVRISCEVVLGVENESETRLSVEVTKIEGENYQGVIRSFSNMPYLENLELGDSISFVDEHIFICKSSKQGF
ncbi:MAG: hypothetical protein KC646_05815 [Candidatus Cloacimonetes bacterium]|nr:hypothetical protein [Candidatus Cloacimonadota bacterium]